ncbi:MAG: hypothetical protein U1E69_22285 [Tabrizicola sp.]|uniref:hypothetical protein n=1 Tax=Tabrizicola sp. TaxID=2005166 RepID=UPI002ABD10B4|nr:hypothetical protein [Tabrizicola sp.]MDZ4089528.1 hypothetical protein [Tabrizicola sp.]
MSPIVKAAFAYVLPVFAAAFVIGAVRVTLVAPALGPLVAVALEVPLVLCLSWWVAGRVLGRWPLSAWPRAGLSLLAFTVLMLLELATALAFGQTPAQFLTGMTTPAGALGLAGQIGFALVPLVRQARG